MHSWTRQMVILTEVEVVQMTDVTVHVHILYPCQKSREIRDKYIDNYGQQKAVQGIFQYLFKIP